MAKGGRGVVSVTELVGALRIPGPFLRRILQQLGRRGLVRSCKGKGGGFRLAVPAGKIFLTDIIETFQGPFNMNECFFKKSVCPNKQRCLLKKRLDLIEKHVASELGEITIGSLIREP